MKQYDLTKDKNRNKGYFTKAASEVSLREPSAEEPLKSFALKGVQ